MSRDAVGDRRLVILCASDAVAVSGAKLARAARVINAPAIDRDMPTLTFERKPETRGPRLGPPITGPRASVTSTRNLRRR